MSTDAKLARLFEANLQESLQWKGLSLQAKGPLAFVLFCVVAISMLLFYSYWNSWTTNLVFGMGDLYRQQLALEDEIAVVRAEIATRESLAEVEKKAVALGMKYNAAQISALPVAYRESGVAPSQPTAGISRFSNRFALGAISSGNLPAALGALVMQFQDWVNAPYTTP